VRSIGNGSDASLWLSAARTTGHTTDAHIFVYDSIQPRAKIPHIMVPSEPFPAAETVESIHTVVQLDPIVPSDDDRILREFTEVALANALLHIPVSAPIPNNETSEKDTLPPAAHSLFEAVSLHERPFHRIPEILNPA